jgi:hypothetical protein
MKKIGDLYTQPPSKEALQDPGGILSDKLWGQIQSGEIKLSITYFNPITGETEINDDMDGEFERLENDVLTHWDIEE